MRTAIAALRLLVIVMLSVAGCNSSAVKTADSTAAPIQVRSAVIEERPMPRFLPLTGSLIANEQSDVAANSSGRVVKTFVERGTLVSKGDPLVQLDRRTAELSAAEAAANLESAEAAQQLADAQCERNSELFQKGAISRDEWESIESRCKTSDSSARAARARAEIARISDSDAVVRAPFSGLVGERFVSVGEYVQPSTKIASVVQITPLRLKLSAPEEAIGEIAQGSEVVFQVSAYPDATFSGTVNHIAPVVDPTTRDVVFEATVANADGRLRPGMFASANLRLADKPVPAVPSDALKTDDGGSRLFLIVKERVEERIVQIGENRDGYVALLDGALVGDRLVLDLTDQVKDGALVQTTGSGR